MVLIEMLLQTKNILKAVVKINKRGKAPESVKLKGTGYFLPRISVTASVRQQPFSFEKSSLSPFCSLLLFRWQEKRVKIL
jgi:hypothetical protein